MEPPGKPGRFNARSDEPWVVNGAAVRVSLVCFSRAHDEHRPNTRLDGEPLDEIHADLTAKRDGVGIDLARARRLLANLGIAFMGDTKSGSFDVPGDLAREWLRLPANPNGRPNADVLKPWMNGMDLTRRLAGKWIISFGWNMDEAEAALYEAPFGYVAEHVRPARHRNRVAKIRNTWWQHERPRPEMWKAIDGLSRYIATPRVAKHRLFVWCDARICPDSAIIAIARDDDTTFGVLHSRFHEAWSLRLGTWLGKGNDPRYTPTTTFETFPFPDGLSPDITAADYADDPHAIIIAGAARRLTNLRDRWLNPPEWVEWVDEPVPGYPKRPVACDEAAAGKLKARTLLCRRPSTPAAISSMSVMGCDAKSILSPMRPSTCWQRASAIRIVSSATGARPHPARSWMMRSSSSSLSRRWWASSTTSDA